jgi:capsular exopolysaccharide synthesis family protein
MSQIFDALLRSEAERAGNGVVAEADATDLLQSVEYQAALKWASASHGGRQNETSSAVALVEPVEEPKAPSRRASAVVDVPSPDRTFAPSHHFSSEPLFLPPECELACIQQEDGPSAEAFRLLGVRLRDLRRTRPLQRLLVTSTIPQEGKSTVAANLACVLAQKKEEKVLLLEGDLRRPALSERFQLKDKSGICDWLRDEQSSASIHFLSEPGFWILPAGHTPSNPLNLLQSKRLSSIMDQLAGWFDWIILDSPPVLPLADTSIWARWAEGILLVARQGVTRKKQLKRGIEALDQKKLVGALMNSATGSLYSGYYYTSSSDSDTLD